MRDIAKVQCAYSFRQVFVGLKRPWQGSISTMQLTRGTQRMGVPTIRASVHRTAPLTPKCMAGRQRAAVKLQPFSGFRRANAVDAVSSPTRPATLQAAVQRSTKAAGRGSRQTTQAMFERFTEKAIKVVMLAQEEARRLGVPTPALVSKCG